MFDVVKLPMEGRAKDSPAQQGEQDPQHETVAGPEQGRCAVGVEAEQESDYHDDPE